MKILKSPKFKPIKCECGCEYEYDGNYNEIQSQVLRGYPREDGEIRHITLYLPCPICGECNELIKEPVESKNTCTCCGAEIPEGRRICKECK